jgi:hypothetical protein
MKQAKPKKTLAEAMEERIKTMAEIRRDKIASEKREKDRVLEDEMMEMMHGPDWRTRYAGEPQPPPPVESEVQLKAS